ncbi:MAG: hypothetical protein M3417_10985 [Actinomycetota bacterium]|nr:hypothetical protein [Actinomycetota bacterium]
MIYSVHIPWYATAFRPDKLEAALAEIAPIALRYGAIHYAVYRSHDDRYKFTHVNDFRTKAQWVAFWDGPEMTRFRALHSGWYQVPVLYTPMDVAAEGSMPDLVPSGDLDSAA